MVTSIQQNDSAIDYEPLKDQIDVLKVELNTPVRPNESYTIKIEYTVKVPNSKFTSYGITNEGDFNLRYWYITPAIYDGEWHYYSNKDLDDLYIPQSEINLEIEYPNGYALTSELDVVETIQNKTKQTVKLHGENRINTKLFLNKQSSFKTIQGDDFTLVSSIDDEGLEVIDKVLITEKVSQFINKNFGQYPHKKLLLTQIDYNKNPIYGLNFLPKFIKPYPNHFQYELKLTQEQNNGYLMVSKFFI